MAYTYGNMIKKYIASQLSDALTVWATNHQLRIKLVIHLNKDGNQYKGHQMQYKGMEMIITGEAYSI